METTFDAVRAEALFASPLQISEAPSDDEIRAMVTTMLQHVGVRECVARVATEFGEHPDSAAARMCWALDRVRSAYVGFGALELTVATSS